MKNLKTLLKLSLCILLTLDIAACKKTGEETPDILETDKGTPTIKIKNSIQAPIEVTVNGKKDTIIFNQELTFTGNKGTTLVATAKSIPYKYSSNLGTGSAYVVPLDIVGDIITWNLNTEFSNSGTSITEIKVPENKYLLSITNSTGNSAVTRFTVNYGIPGKNTTFTFASTYVRSKNQFIGTDYIYNNGVTFPIGFFDVISPTSVVLFGITPTLTKQWTFQGVGIKGGSMMNFIIKDE